MVWRCGIVRVLSSRSRLSAPADTTSSLHRNRGSIAGTPYGYVAGFAADHAPEGLIVHLEAAAHDAFTICRYLHGMRLAGILYRSQGCPGGPHRRSRQRDVNPRNGLCSTPWAAWGVPIIADVECGHVPPYLPIVNGALGACGSGRAPPHS